MSKPWGRAMSLRKDDFVKDAAQQPHKCEMLIIGVGPGGCADVKTILAADQGIAAHYIAVDSNAASLAKTFAGVENDRLEVWTLGPKDTLGYGTGGNPDLAAQIFNEHNQDRIKPWIKKFKGGKGLVLMLVHTGGGTSGAAVPI